jgi:hypothetical protein
LLALLIDTVGPLGYFLCGRRRSQAVVVFASSRRSTSHCGHLSLNV